MSIVVWKIIRRLPKPLLLVRPNRGCKPTLASLKTESQP